MKKQLSNVPLLGPAARTGFRAFRKRVGSKADRAVLRDLRATGRKDGDGSKIADAIEALDQRLPVDERLRVEAIERTRARLFRRHEPLVDGSLGPAGSFDDGVSVATACSVSKPARSARFLYHLIRAYRPQQVLELGTNIGISAAYQAAALAANGDGGRVVTLEASAYRMRLAQTIHTELELENVTYVTGLSSHTLAPTLADLAAVDFAFIDGRHDYLPTLDTFDAVWRHATPSTVFAFDDIRWSESMAAAWADLQGDDRLGLVVDLSSMGVCVPSRDGVRRRLPAIRHAFT